jgi:hypothetical protein
MKVILLLRMLLNISIHQVEWLMVIFSVKMGLTQKKLHGIISTNFTNRVLKNTHPTPFFFAGHKSKMTLKS